MYYLVRVFKDGAIVAACTIKKNEIYGTPYLYNAARLCDRETCIVQIARDTILNEKEVRREELFLGDATWEKDNYIATSNSGKVILRVAMSQIQLERIPNEIRQQWILNYVKGAAMPSPMRE